MKRRSGLFIFSFFFLLIPYSVLSQLLGDVNNSGAVNETDAAIIRSRLRGESQQMPMNLDVWDYNGDGIIDSSDLVSIQRYFPGGLERVFGLGEINAVSFSPDGKRLTIGGAGSSVIDTETWTRVMELGGHKAPTKVVEYSPDGRLLATCSAEQEVSIWDAATGALLRTIPVWATSASFSPDGSLIVLGSNAAIVCETDTGDAIASLGLGTGKVFFLPDGKRVMRCDLKSVFVWDIESGEQVGALDTGFFIWINSAALTPDGNRVLLSTTSGGRMWDIATNALTVFNGSGIWKRAAYSPDGTTVTAVRGDGSVAAFDSESGNMNNVLMQLPETPINIAFSSDTMKLVNYTLTKANVWDIPTSDGLRSDPTTPSLAKAFLPGHLNIVTSAVCSPGGETVITGSLDGTARIWSTSTGENVRTIQVGAAVSRVAVSPDGQTILTASNDNNARLWSTSTGEKLITYSGHLGPVSSVAFSSSGTLVLTASGDNTAKLFNISPMGKPIRTFSGHTAAIDTALFSPDDTKILTGSSDGSVRLWDTESGEEIWSFHTLHEVQQSLGFSPDGTLIGINEEIINAETRELVLEIPGKFKSFSPDGNTIAALNTPYQMAVEIRRFPSGELLQTFTGHASWILPAQFSPDGKMLVTGSDDKTARLWSLAQ